MISFIVTILDGQNISLVRIVPAVSHPWLMLFLIHVVKVRYFYTILPDDCEGTQVVFVLLFVIAKLLLCNHLMYCIVLYCIVLYCIVLYCFALYCIVLVCIVCIGMYCMYWYCQITKALVYGRSCCLQKKTSAHGFKLSPFALLYRFQNHWGSTSSRKNGNFVN